MHDEPFKLTRRKALAGLGTIGVAGAGAGLGTSALFSDEEVFEDNTFTAGTLDMSVTAQVVAANEEYPPSEGPIDYMETADGEIITGFQFNDIKPGDWFIVCYDIDVTSNSGYVTVHGGNYSEGGGETPDPEPTPDEGELGDRLLVTHWTNFASGGTSRGDLSKLDPTTNKSDNQPVDEAWGNPDADGNAILGGGTSASYTDVLEFLFGVDQDPQNQGGLPNETTQLGNGYASTDGVVIRGDNPESDVDDSGGIGGGGGPLEEIGGGEGTQTFYQLIELPNEVGNEVQGDTVSWDLGFVTQQARNNDSAPREYPTGFNQTET